MKSLNTMLTFMCLYGLAYSECGNCVTKACIDTGSWPEDAGSSCSQLGYDMFLAHFWAEGVDVKQCDDSDALISCNNYSVTSECVYECYFYSLGECDDGAESAYECFQSSTVITPVCE